MLDLDCSFAQTEVHQKFVHSFVFLKLHASWHRLAEEDKYHTPFVDILAQL